MCKVLLMFSPAALLQELAKGYDSIIGEPSRTSPCPSKESGALNYDELVVYRKEAAIPSYLIVYSL